jgi:hypothetical protein
LLARSSNRASHSETSAGCLLLSIFKGRQKNAPIKTGAFFHE